LSYKDRLRTLRYTSPSGSPFDLRFTEVSRNRDKKAVVSEFPLQDQGGIQDLGQATPRYPITCFIDGPDYDREADRLWEALNESGPGELEHPRYGTLSVLPTSVSQSESFTDGAGRATFEIDFVFSDEISLEYPRTQDLARGRVAAQADEAAASVVADVADPSIDDTGAVAGGLPGTPGGVSDSSIDDPGAIERLKADVQSGIDSVVGAFDTVEGISDDVRTSIQSAARGITSEIDSLVQAPQDLAESLLSLYRTPADVATDVEAKINGYGSIIDTIAASAEATTSRYGGILARLGLAQVNGAAVAAAQASASGESGTRLGAVNAALELRRIADRASEATEAIGVVAFESVRATRQALTDAINAAIESSLSLPVERVTVLESDTTPLNLAYDLYGVDADVDEMADRIIEYNGIGGADILMIPAGTEVRWYV